MGPGEVVVGRYRIERELGRGGMGAVYLARDQQAGDRLIAIKVASASGHAHDAFMARFEREARIGCALGQSKGFVRAFDWGEVDSRTVYLAMDLVDGARALDLRNGALDEKLARVEAVAGLVERAHSLGVMHRDLKPGNCLVDSKGVLWLADFGLAKHTGDTGAAQEAPSTADLTQTGVGMGTPQFMPPEQFENARDADERADVYALGTMLFVALTGRYPYDGSASEVLSKQIKVQMGQAPAPRPRDHDPGISLGLDSLCAEATHVDKARRTGSARIFLAALRKARTRISQRVPAARPGMAPAAPATPTPPAAAVAPPAEAFHTLPDLGPAGPGPLPGSLTARVMTSLQAVKQLLVRPTDPPGAPPGVTAQTLKAAAPVIVSVLLLLAAILLVKLARDGDGPDRAADPPLTEAPPPPSTQPPGEVDLDELQRRAQRGDIEARVELAARLDHAQATVAEIRQAVGHYTTAALAGNVDAMMALYSIYDDGRPGVRANAYQARTWLERAAEQGNAEAQQTLEYERERERMERGGRYNGG